MKLSFIVPIYGVEQYLRKCVDSLLHQDYDDYEIILVDDGGKDGCPAICDEYANKYDNIKVVHQENRGLSGARNGGIPVAKGEYICFVDSDDYWEPNVLACLMAQIERDKLDVLRFRWQNVREDGLAFTPYKEGSLYRVSDIISDGELFVAYQLGLRCYAWQFILHRSLCDKDFFTEGILLEDVDWTPRMLLQARRVGETDKVVYNYLWRTGSITLATNSEKKRKMLGDQLIVLNTLQKLRSHKQIETWCRSVQTMIARNYMDSVAQNVYAEREGWCRKLKETGVLPLLQTEKRVKAKIKIWLINFSPMVYTSIFKRR